MTRSIFDPSGDTERSGSTFTPPQAEQDSHLPETADETKADGSIDVEFDGEGKPAIEKVKEQDQTAEDL